jgi:hypothetical protein
VELDARTALTHAEHARPHEPVGERRGEPIDYGSDVDRAAELVEERLVLWRRENGENARLLLATDEPSRHTGRPERRGTLGDVRPTDENPLPPEQPRPELALEALPLSPRANRKANEALVVMPMPKHPRPSRRLPRPGRSGLAAHAVDAAPLKRVRRRQPADPTANDGDLGGESGHRHAV